MVSISLLLVFECKGYIESTVSFNCWTVSSSMSLSYSTYLQLLYQMSLSLRICSINSDNLASY